ncbi:AI-2E family transporter [Stratiformator vulcanicus]|uniref:AI-2E family transporter n=1 Tax=Stratiformator vulcanicus TaxID=2527980 RepID=A0A517R2Y9_9PLAN|nr:AI-2E family transporter [Stratiformator vulcanicus]QDT38246.1 hypothetical protein Pan189_26360 [Stratiformator vulcanicus]
MSNESGNTESDGRHIWEYTVVQDIFWITAIGLLIFAGFLMRAVVVPVLIAFGLAYALNPVVSWVKNTTGQSRSLAAFEVVALLTAIFVGSLVIGVPTTLNEISEFVVKFPEYTGTAVDRIEKLDGPDWLKQSLQQVTEDPPKPRQVLGTLGGYTSEMLGVTLSFISLTFYLLSCLALVPVLVFFFASSLDEWIHSARDLIPSQHRDEVVDIVAKMDNAVGSFLRGRLIAMAFLCVGISLGWLFVGVPYAIVLGLLAGILGAAPFLSYFIWPLAIAFCYAESMTSGEPIDWLYVFVWPSLVFNAVQIIENYVITPWVQSESMQMRAATVLIVIFMGGSIGGIYGVLLALPLAGCIKVLMMEAVLPRWRSWAEGT